MNPENQTARIGTGGWEFVHENSVWKKIIRNKAAVTGSILLSVFMISCFVPTIWTSALPDAQGDILDDSNLPPSLEHPFGTDKFARDVLSRVLYGGRVSLTIAMGTVTLSVIIGVFYGAISGYAGGLIDAAMMRLLDLLLAFPVVMLAIAIAAIYQPDYWYLIPLLAFTGWMETARLVRAEVLSVKEREFVLAAECLGLPRQRILVAHILPNSIAPVLLLIPLKIGDTILLESSLSFLGIGVQPPVPSWGNMISDGRAGLSEHWWMIAFAGLFLILTVIAFNLIGEALRDANNPRNGSE
ncbi:MAG: ABC transporter permease [Calditrichaeota bacterium]|nr:MAG: ABC transporter permease [Calditrichota bacterium]